MITTNQENLLDYLDNDIEANQTKSIKEDEDTEPVNHSDQVDRLQDHLVVTGIPMIARDSNEEVGECEENEGSAHDSPLASKDLCFSRHFTCGLMLGSFFVWPAIRICFFYLLTRCKPIGSLFSLEDIEQDPEMQDWFMALNYDPDHASAIWRIIFMVETRAVNIMMLFFFLALCLSKKNGCLRNKGELHGVIYSPMVTNVASFLVLGIMRSSNTLLCVDLLLIAILLAIMGYALDVAVTAGANMNGAVDFLYISTAYIIWATVALCTENQFVY